NAGFVFGYDSSGYPHFTARKSTSPMRIVGSPGITSGVWMQLAVTWDGTVGNSSAAQIFLNGLQLPNVTTQDGSGTIGDATSSPFRIGNGSIEDVGSLNGKIAYLAVYKGRILTPSEMRQLDAQLPIR